MATPAGNNRILGLGCAAVDDVIYVPTHPERDGKQQVLRTERRFGGLTGAALVAAARLGAGCAYAGQLGADILSASVRENFIREGIDVSRAPSTETARVVHSTIIVAEDDGSRCVFFEADGQIGAHPELPAEDCIRSCSVLVIDHSGIPGSLRAARIARSAGIGVVADFEEDTHPQFAELLALVDHLILPADFALHLTRKSNARDAATALWRNDRAATIVTCGAEGCWCAGAEPDPKHYPTFSIKAADTTGCGDVFHGAYAAALARGTPLAERIRFASAAAALRAKLAAFPSAADVEKLLSNAENHLIYE